MTNTSCKFCLVVYRTSRRVIDAKELRYSWELDELLARHDPARVDFIIRFAELTQQPKPNTVEGEQSPATDTEAPQGEADDNIPF